MPVFNVYNLCLLTAKGKDEQAVSAVAEKNVIIFTVLAFLSFIPLLGIIGFITYFKYRLLYRWTSETRKAVQYTILSFITLGLFYNIYGLMKMNKPFVA